MPQVNGNSEMTPKATSELSVVMPPHRHRSGESSWGDLLGIIASIGCAIHCAAMPFVFAYLPAFGFSFLADPAFHKWMALICFLIAIVAFVPGLKKHGNWLPVSLAASGLVLITFAAFGLSDCCCSSCSTCKPGGAELNSSTVATVSIEETQETFSDATELPPVELVKSAKTIKPVTSAELVVPETNSTSNFLAFLAPWITPIGGFLLVTAHLTNRRCGCSCSCCQ